VIARSVPRCAGAVAASRACVVAATAYVVISPRRGLRGTTATEATTASTACTRSAADAVWQAPTATMAVVATTIRGRKDDDPPRRAATARRNTPFSCPQ